MNLIPAKMLNAYRNGDADVAVSADWANLAATKVIDAKTIGLKFQHVEDLISAEEVARIAGDEALQTNISAEEAARILEVSIERVARIAGDEALQSNIDAIEDNFEDAISEEASIRAAADVLLQANISAEEAARLLEVSIERVARIAADDALQANITAEESARSTADTSLESALAAEVLRAGAAELSLAADVQTNEDQIDAMLSLSTTDKDSFFEIVSFVSAVDLENDNALLSAISEINSDIATESSTRLSADTVLQANISAEEAARVLEVSIERVARIAGDEALQANISAEEAARILEVSIERVARIAGDEALQANISAEEAARILEVSIERAARLSVDDVLQSNIDVVVNDLASLEADFSLDLSIEIEEVKDLITDEEARATAVEATLNGAIIAEAAVRQSQDSVLSSVDVVLSNRINVEASIRTSADEVLSVDISQEIADTNADVISIDSAISAEEVARIAADEYLQSQIDTLDLDYVSDTDFVAESTDFNQVALLGDSRNDMSVFVGTNVFSFELPTSETLVAGTMSVFINGIEVFDAESDYENAISLPFDLEASDTISVKYIKK